MMTRFEKLCADIRACRVCEADLPHEPRPVLQADPAAKIIIAGQAPGRRVHESGVPFDDPSGDRLREWMGIDRETFYNPARIAIVPMGFCYPGTGKSGDLPPRPECAATWHARVFDALPNRQLMLVIGQYAMQYHLRDRQKKNLTETVRAWREYWPHMLPLPHPSPRNNIWLRKNDWFEKEILSVLRKRISELM